MFMHAETILIYRWDIDGFVCAHPRERTEGSIHRGRAREAKWLRLEGLSDGQIQKVFQVRKYENRGWATW